MPGVRELLDALAPRDDVYLALLTGNYEAGARLKLEYFDLWKYFPCGAFGDDAPHRNVLVPKALARVAACGGPDVRRRATRSSSAIRRSTSAAPRTSARARSRSRPAATRSRSCARPALTRCSKDLSDTEEVVRISLYPEVNGARWPSRSSKSVASR